MSNNAAKQVLMISFPFPPIGGLAPIRTMLMANYLAIKNYKVNVVTITPSQGFPQYDESLLGQVRSDVGVYRVFPGILHKIRYRKGYDVFSTKSKFKILDFLKNNFLIPCSNFIWFFPAFVRAILLVKGRGTILYSSGNPFTTHVLAALLQAIFNIKWIMYVSDPYYLGAMELSRPKLRKTISKFLEGTCLKRADKVIINCEAIEKGLKELYMHDLSNKLVCISDGYDKKRYGDVSASSDHSSFKIVYTGSFQGGAREPYNLIEAVKNLNDVELIIGGCVSEELLHYIGYNKIKNVQLLGYVSHDNVIKLQKSADLLVIFGWSGGYQVPGKLFEYFAARKPILAIGADTKDIVVEMINKFARGVVVENKTGPLQAMIVNLLNEWKAGSFYENYNLQELSEFSWDELLPIFYNTVKELR